MNWPDVRAAAAPWRWINVPLVCPRCGSKVRFKARVKSAQSDEAVALDYVTAIGCSLCAAEPQR